MKKSVILYLIPFFLSLLTPLAQAKSEKIRDISAPEVKNMLEGGQAVLIHVLSKTEYDMQHIPESINIPVIHMKTTSAFPQDKTTPLVFYSMGKK